MNKILQILIKKLFYFFNQCPKYRLLFVKKQKIQEPPLVERRNN